MSGKREAMRVFNADVEYGPGMDKQVIELCNAMNSLPGVETTESCCGHGREPFRVFFRVNGEDSMEGLFFLTRCADRRYWKYGGIWRIWLTVGDAVSDGFLPTCFVLDSGESKGMAAYRQAKDLVRNMNHHLNHEAFVRCYKLDLRRFRHKVTSRRSSFAP